MCAKHLQLCGKFTLIEVISIKRNNFLKLQFFDWLPSREKIPDCGRWHTLVDRSGLESWQQPCLWPRSTVGDSAHGLQGYGRHLLGQRPNPLVPSSTLEVMGLLFMWSYKVSPKAQKEPNASICPDILQCLDSWGCNTLCFCCQQGWFLESYSGCLQSSGSVTQL